MTVATAWIINGGTCTGSLTINGVHLTGQPAWTTLDLSPLWVTGTRRGQDILLGGVSGLQPRTRRITATVYTVPMALTGRVDRFGTFESNPWVGLEANIAWLRTNLLDAMEQRPAVLVKPSGAMQTADVQIEDFQLGDHDANAQCEAVLTFSVAAGNFV